MQGTARKYLSEKVVRNAQCAMRNACAILNGPAQLLLSMSANSLALNMPFMPSKLRRLILQSVHHRPPLHSRRATSSPFGLPSLAYRVVGCYDVCCNRIGKNYCFTIRKALKESSDLQAEGPWSVCCCGTLVRQRSKIEYCCP